MLDFMIEKISVWDALRTAQKPIVLLVHEAHQHPVGVVAAEEGI